MQDLSVKRTLVKSPPELWSELSEAERLARHLDAFGDIKITRLEPESTVAWEGEGASGTVSIEPSGWGTKVTLTARVEGDDPVPEPPAPEPPRPTPSPSPWPPSPPPRRPPRARACSPACSAGSVAVRSPGRDQPVWVAGAPPTSRSPWSSSPSSSNPSSPMSRRPPRVGAAAEPAPAPDPDAPLTPAGAQAALEGALEALGSAHHRPFSRG